MGGVAALELYWGTLLRLPGHQCGLLDRFHRLFYEVIPDQSRLSNIYWFL